MDIHTPCRCPRLRRRRFDPLEERLPLPQFLDTGGLVGKAALGDGERVAVGIGISAPQMPGAGGRRRGLQGSSQFPLHICGVKPTVSEESQFSQQVCGVEAKHTLHTCEPTR